MLGRAAYQTPYMLAEVDRRLFGDERAGAARAEVLDALIPYVERHLARGGRLNNIMRHILGLYHGQPRARAFRRLLSEQGPAAALVAISSAPHWSWSRGRPPARRPSSAVLHCGRSDLASRAQGC